MRLKLLDCTLRDGGYVNDWRFGETQIKEISRKVIDSNVDIIELGFLKNEPYQKDRTVFNDVAQLIPLIPEDRNGKLFVAMVEVLNPIPLEKLTPYDGHSIDMIRVIVWKRLLNEGFAYCKGIVEKGYKLCVQPARTDQYTLEEFAKLVQLFSSINPYAIYVVDSWGTMHEAQLMQYFEITDATLKPETALGYHGHNNLLQAFGVAQSFIKRNFDRQLILDASVFGIGRGAGNLNIEVIAHYLNNVYNTRYNLLPMVDVYQNYLKSIFEDKPWGYSFGFFLTAIAHCNPEYANYYIQKGVEETVIREIIETITEDDKIMFSKDKANEYLFDYTHAESGKQWN